jgi:metallo-beta-lactamase family protein
MKIRFIGAVGSVTGSCTLIEHGGEFFLVDCGAGQDSVASETTPLDFKPAELRSMFLTHAHLDHCGLIPALIAQGFRGRIYCTAATRDLTINALNDSVTLGKCDRQHVPASDQFECPDEHPDYKWGIYLPATDDLTVSMARTSHILGSVAVSFQFADATAPRGRRTICFSGDVGCNEDGNCFQALLAKRYQPDAYPSYLVLESTYGSRCRPADASDFAARMAALQEMIERALSLSDEPLLLIPCFTLHRTQELMVDLHCLMQTQVSAETLGRWSEHLGRTEDDGEPLLDIAIESKLAWAHTAIYRRELARTLNTGKGKPLYLNGEFAARAGKDGADGPALLTALFEEPSGWSETRLGKIRFRMSADRPRGGCIRMVIAGSGMCQGGRILEYLRDGLPKPGVLVVLMGFQAPDTPGAQLKKRMENPAAPMDLARWKLPNEIKATIMDLGRFYSGHADQAGLVKFALWKDSPKYAYAPLRRIFLNHGEQSSREALKQALTDFARTQPESSRSLESVELPNRDAGWFDLKTNAWTDIVEPRIDGTNALIAGLYRKVRALEAEVRELKESRDSNRSAKDGA